MKNLKPTLIARQGDVGIIAHPQLAATIAVLPDPDGSAVAARGEVTGHRHRFDAADGVTLRCERVDTAADRLLAEIGAGGATLRHEEHGPIEITQPVELRIQRQYQYGRSARVED